MLQRYKDDRLYCPECKEQPKSFREVIHWQVNVVDRDGNQIDTHDGNVEYECPQCGGMASWGNELNP
jgi:rubredoxin